MFPNIRLRRLRQNPILRTLISETKINIEKLVLPLFIRHGSGVRNPISSMPGHFQLSVDQLDDEIKTLKQLGLKSVILFGIPAEKDAFGSDSFADDGIIQSAVKKIKTIAPEMLIITDVCLCEYTDHGHCGFITQRSNTEVCIDNDKTLELLGKQVVSHAKAGVDVIAPSGNMDGMVQAIRASLDKEGFSQVPILSYSVKYASAMYGPFRQATEGAPQFGDRKTYQMDYANSKEALREAALDVLEGADMLMVKPAHTYLDVIFRIKQSHHSIPLCAYHTSGEFALIKAAAEKGWIDERKTALEVLTSIQRAGADFIITYYAKAVASWMQE